VQSTKAPFSNRFQASTKQFMLNQYSFKEKATIIATFCLYVDLFILENTPAGAPIALGLAIFVIGINNLKFSFAPYHLFFLIFILYCYATTFWALNGYYTLTVANGLVQSLMVMSVFYAAFSPMRNNVNTLIKTMLCGGYVVIFYSFLFYGFGRILSMSEDSMRINNSFINVNVLGMMAALMMLFHIYLHLFEKRRKDIVFIIFAIIIIGATQSRKAIFMAIMGPLLLFWFKSRTGPRHNLLPFVRFIFIAFVLLVLLDLLSNTGMFHGAYERMMGFVNSLTGEGEVDSSTSLRAYYRQVGWEQFLKTPLLGVGINNAPLILANAGSSHRTYLHCNYAELAACGGLFALISFYSIHTYILTKELKYAKKDPSAVLFLVWMFLILTTDWGAVSYYTKRTFFNFIVFFLHIQQMKQRYPEIK